MIMDGKKGKQIRPGLYLFTEDHQDQLVVIFDAVDLGDNHADGTPCMDFKYWNVESDKLGSFNEFWWKMGEKLTPISSGACFETAMSRASCRAQKFNKILDTLNDCS